MINEYRFGLIIINRKKYGQDVEIRWTGEVLDWHRKEVRIVDLEDVKKAVDQKPETIIIGTGEKDFLEITENARKFIFGNGIELIVDKTEEAVKTFNIILEESEEEEGKKNRIIGLFHLT